MYLYTYIFNYFTTLKGITNLKTIKNVPWPAGSCSGSALGHPCQPFPGQRSHGCWIIPSRKRIRSDSLYLPLFASAICAEIVTSSALHMSHSIPTACNMHWYHWDVNNTSTAGSSTALTSFQSLWTEKEHTHNNNDVLGLQVHDTESGRDSSLGVLWSCHGPRRSCPHTNELRQSPGLRARNQTCFHLAIQMCPHSFRSLNGVRWSPPHACKCHWQSPLFPAPDICQPG